MLPVTTNVGAGVGDGVGVGVGLGDNVALGRAVGLGLGQGEAGLPPHPAMASTRTNAAHARPVEPRTLSIPGLALTLCLPLSSKPLQDDASGKRA